MPSALGPNGFRIIITKDGASSPHLTLTHTVKRKAESLCTSEAKKCGLGARGEVLGGPKQNEIVKQGRIVRDDRGRLTWREEEK